ncbi:class C beta-lactamase [Pseudohongiella spirulinae]|uniref:Beta-lactamase n=1 Tax=Pseudohongiella spirulinae TaxID=1249552 RepID=A0A0S2KCV8_9GAMM|nr:class C beta-lactamase [Pseudohongiella spirulinae]ALO45823.1 Beta-lactamase [Pseudohongiella spirulinae]
MQTVLRLSVAVVLTGVMACTPQLDAPEDQSINLQSLVDSAITPVIEEYAIPGMAVALIHEGQVHYFNYGVSSLQSGDAVTQHTIFELGSVSKLFNATLTTYAQAVGALSLRDYPSRFMPELQNTPVDSASLLHLGTYTAGGFPLQFPAYVTDHASMVEYYRQWQPDFGPGESRLYSNPSIGLMGHLAGLALGQSYTEVVEGQVFPAMGMTESYIQVPETESEHYAWGYNAEDQPIRVTPGVLDAEAYGVKSSSSDMIRFVRANISPDSLDALWSQAITDTQKQYFRLGEFIQSLGWEQFHLPVSAELLRSGSAASIVLEPNTVEALDPDNSTATPVWIHKTGSTNGFGAYVVVLPAQQSGIVMLANRNYPNTARIQAAWDILSPLLDL